MRCVVCDGKGFVQAAPLSIRTGQNNNHRKALWDKAVVVPCFACTGAQVVLV
jgi:RecJ-like exonuclease